MDSYVHETTIFDVLKLPPFLNTQDKWNAVVESIDSAYKFDEIALQILDDDDLDIFDFRDIISALGQDVKNRRPGDGPMITLLTETITDILDFLFQKSEERLTKLIKKMSESYDE